MKKKWTIQILCMLGILLMFSSCYHRRAHHQMHAAMVEYSNKQLDSISFSTTHHYTNKFNFLVFKDSLELIAQQPEEFLSNLPIDSFAVRKNCLLVVTDIRMVPQDSHQKGGTCQEGESYLPRLQKAIHSSNICTFSSFMIQK